MARSQHHDKGSKVIARSIKFMAASQLANISIQKQGILATHGPEELRELKEVRMFWRVKLCDRKHHVPLLIHSDSVSVQSVRGVTVEGGMSDASPKQ
jgi:hypothetical protein